MFPRDLRWKFSQPQFIENLLSVQKVEEWTFPADTGPKWGAHSLQHPLNPLASWVKFWYWVCNDWKWETNDPFMNIRIRVWGLANQQANWGPMGWFLFLVVWGPMITGYREQGATFYPMAEKEKEVETIKAKHKSIVTMTSLIPIMTFPMTSLLHVTTISKRAESLQISSQWIEWYNEPPAALGTRETWQRFMGNHVTSLIHYYKSAPIYITWLCDSLIRSGSRIKLTAANGGRYK